MKIQHIFFLTLTFLFLFSACKKDPYKYEVSGTVTEFGTNEPIAGAEVYLFDCDTDGSATYCDTAQILITDERGRYRSPFLSQAGRFPMVSAKMPKYFPSSQHFVTENENDEIDFVLDPFAWLSLRVVNEAPAGEFDRISIGTFFPQSPVYLDGQYVDELYLLKKVGNRNLIYTYSVFSSGQLSEQIRDTLYLSAHDTLNYEIRY